MLSTGRADGRVQDVEIDTVARTTRGWLTFPPSHAPAWWAFRECLLPLTPAGLLSFIALNP